MPITNELLDVMMGGGRAAVPPVPPAQTPVAPVRKEGNFLTRMLDKVGQGIGDLQRIHPEYHRLKRNRETVVKAIQAMERGEPGYASMAAGADPELGLQMLNTGVDNDRMERTAKAEIAERRARFEDLTHRRGAAIIGGATKETWPIVRQQALDYYSGRGVEPIFELSEDFDEATQQMIQFAEMTPEEQVKFKADQAYRREQLRLREEAQKGVESRFRRSQTATQGREDARQKLTDRRRKEDKAFRETQAEKAHRRRLELRRRGRTAKVEYGFRPDGTRYPKN